MYTRDVRLQLVWRSARTTRAKKKEKRQERRESSSAEKYDPTVLLSNLNSTIAAVTRTPTRRHFGSDFATVASTTNHDRRLHTFGAKKATTGENC